MTNKGVADEVQRALDNDKNLRSYGLEVSGNKDQVVLTGVVDVLADKLHAERVAKEIAGEKNVENAITISTDGQIDDGDVRFEVGEELGLYPEDELRELSIESNRGVVTLQGHLSDSQLLKKAVEAAAKARGVVQVVSKIEVEDE